jgi:glutamyl-tRNA synthetase
MFARKHGGAFILRIEDTDQKRYVPEAEEDIKESLRWLGMEWDEGPDIGGDYGPYRQSERGDLYRQWAEWLIEKGHAYRCTCSPERLAAVREEQQKSGGKPGYDRHCRDLALGAEAGAHVVRFRMPGEGETAIDDLIRGPIFFQNADLEDLVLLKSDGLPTYHLANVVDDHYMEISHIMRADEWIATAPLHHQLYKAFEWQMPKIGHVPVILSPSGKGKLSKRDQAFQEGDLKILVQVREFRQAGYLPEALVNFLLNVGWAFGEDREVFSAQEAFERFRIEDIHPAGSRLPYEKLDWLNGVYIRALAPDDLVARLKPQLEAAGLNVELKRLEQVAPLVQERLKTLSEVIEMAGFMFRESIVVDKKELVIKNQAAPVVADALRRVHHILAELPAFDHAMQEAALRALAEHMGIKAGDLFGCVRMAITGQKVSPPLFETMEILGRELSLSRIQAAIELVE